MGKLSSYLALLFLLFVATACLKEIEQEPYDPEIELADMMIWSQYHLAEWMTSDFARYPLMWSQQISGVLRVHVHPEIYSLHPEDFNESWREYYNELFQRLFVISMLADEHDEPAYGAISRIMQAFAMGMAADAWGSMPFSEAHKYLTMDRTPIYDSQQELYDAMFSMLDDAIHLLETRGTEGARPGTGIDFFYEGDIDAWLRLARFVRLKFSLRLGHEANDYQQAYMLIQEGGMLSGVQDDMVFPYGSLEGLNNPWFTFDFNIGNTRAGEKLVNLLLETNDPRLTRYVRITSTTNEYVGAAPGSLNLNTSRLANTVNAVANPHKGLTLISYAEQKFIKAEVFYRQGMQQLADEAYRQGVIASLSMHQARNAEWEERYANKENVDLEQIMTGKYLALFLHPEVWTDWRRTGFPELSAAAGNMNNDTIPRRFLYPVSEIISNSSNVPDGVTINTRVWWDQR